MASDYNRSFIAVHISRQGQAIVGKCRGVQGPFTNYVGSLRGRGDQPRTNFCLLCLICLPMKGGGGVKNSNNLAYVVCEWSLTQSLHLQMSLRTSWISQESFVKFLVILEAQIFSLVSYLCHILKYECKQNRHLNHFILYSYFCFLITETC